MANRFASELRMHPNALQRHHTIVQHRRNRRGGNYRERAARQRRSRHGFSSFDGDRKSGAICDALAVGVWSSPCTSVGRTSDMNNSLRIVPRLRDRGYACIVLKHALLGLLRSLLGVSRHQQPIKLDYFSFDDYEARQDTVRS